MYAPAHVLMRLYPIDKSLVCLQSRKKDVMLEYVIHHSICVVLPVVNMQTLITKLRVAAFFQCNERTLPVLHRLRGGDAFIISV
jgi:hypothetical protein